MDMKDLQLMTTGMVLLIIMMGMVEELPWCLSHLLNLRQVLCGEAGEQTLEINEAWVECLGIEMEVIIGVVVLEVIMIGVAGLGVTTKGVVVLWEIMTNVAEADLVV
ncbi:hypothetical protein, partial [Salmonella sp. s51228]|uniref:hypothetical protein n=1 Tax=Salmonella sp. s51228 TaxID=3159652 RepID=UPI00397F8DD1